MQNPPLRTEEPPTPGNRGRRPPLAEVDTWELWQAWRRGERRAVAPWLGLLAGFCVVLAAMYSFFYVSTQLTGDVVAQVGLSIVFVVFMYFLWRRISPRQGFALMVVAAIVAVSGLAFVIWLAAYRLSGWNLVVGVGGTVLLGLVGLVIGLPSLNALGRK